MRALTSIKILDLLPADESGVPVRLEEYMRHFTAAGRVKVAVTYLKIRDRYELERAILKILEECLQAGDVPLLHIEAHGSESEIEVGVKDKIPWHDFYSMLRVINIATKNNLVLAYATCRAAWSMLHVSLAQECPVCAIIGPVDDISVGEVEEGYKAFYRTLLQEGDLPGCLDALNSHVCSKSNQFTIINAEEIFNDGASAYVKHHCQGTPRRKRLDSLITRAVSEGLTREMPLSEIRKRLKADLWSEAKPRLLPMFNRFMMIDRFPENGNRFSLDSI